MSAQYYFIAGWVMVATAVIVLALAGGPSASPDSLESPPGHSSSRFVGELNGSVQVWETPSACVYWEHGVGLTSVPRVELVIGYRPCL